MSSRTPSRGRTYLLTLPKVVKHEAVLPRAKRKITPPKPKQGDRRPRAYSRDELDALYATAHSINWQSMISLKTPPARRIVTHAKLVSILTGMKRKLENLRKRNGFPVCIAVTEFDPDEREGITINTANFHLAFAAKLTEAQQATVRDWWLEAMSLQSNQGRYFQYDAKGGGPKLQSYIAKDIRAGERWVKFPVEWLPPRIDCRLWFVVGTKRLGAKTGRKLRASTHQKRRRFEGEHACRGRQQLRASTHSLEGEHPSHPRTTDNLPVILPTFPAVMHDRSSSDPSPLITAKQLIRIRIPTSSWAERMPWHECHPQSHRVCQTPQKASDRAANPSNHIPQ